MQWSNATKTAVHGMTALDAYGAALDYMTGLIKQHNRRAVIAWTTGRGGKTAPAKLDTFKKDAKWRMQRMGNKQFGFLKKLGVRLLLSGDPLSMHWWLAIVCFHQQYLTQQPGPAEIHAYNMFTTNTLDVVHYNMGNAS